MKFIVSRIKKNKRIKYAKNKMNPDNFISKLLDGNSGIDHVNAEKADMFNEYLCLGKGGREELDDVICFAFQLQLRRLSSSY